MLAFFTYTRDVWAVVCVVLVICFDQPFYAFHSYPLPPWSSSALLWLSDGVLHGIRTCSICLYILWHCFALLHCLLWFAINLIRCVNALMIPNVTQLSRFGGLSGRVVSNSISYYGPIFSTFDHHVLGCFHRCFSCYRCYCFTYLSRVVYHCNPVN